MLWIRILAWMLRKWRQEGNDSLQRWEAVLCIGFGCFLHLCQRPSIWSYSCTLWSWQRAIRNVCYGKASWPTVMNCIAPHLRHALRSSHDEPKEHSSGRPTTPSDNLSDGVAGYLSKHTRSCSTQPRLDLPPPDRLRTVASFATGKWMGRIGEVRGPWESVDLDRVFIIRAKGERQVFGTYCCCSEAVGAIG